MEDYLDVNQSRLCLAEFFCGKAISLQVTGAPICEEHVGILQKVIELGTIFFGAIQYRGTHPNLHIPGKGLHLRIIRPPDVEDVGTVAGQVSADAGSGNHVPQSERANAFQWALCAVLERQRLALSDFFQSNQWHSGEHIGVLGLFAKLIVGTHHGDDKPGLCRGRLQLLRAPLQNGIANGFGAIAAPQEIQRPRLQPGVKVESHHVTPVACFTEERQFEERVIAIHTHRGRASVDRFPFPLEEAAEAPESFPDVDMNVLSFASSGFPERCHRYGFGSKGNSGHGAKSETAGHDRILSVKRQLSSRVRSAESHAAQ